MQETSKYQDQLFNSYAKLRYIAASVGPISEADDLVHDAFEYFLKKEDQYKDHENLEAIVILKMKSINIDKWRKKSGTNFEEKDEEFIKDTLYGKLLLNIIEKSKCSNIINSPMSKHTIPLNIFITYKTKNMQPDMINNIEYAVHKWAKRP